MGQRSPAIVYGCYSDEDFYGYDEESGEDVGLACVYENTGAKPPSIPYEDTMPTVFYAVAVGGSGSDDDDIPYLDPVPLDEIPAFYSKSYAVAVDNWNAFAKWCKEERGVELPNAKLYFTIVETG